MDSGLVNISILWKADVLVITELRSPDLIAPQTLCEVHKLCHSTVGKR